MIKEGFACALTLDRAVQLFERDTLTFRPLEPELRMSSVLVWKKLDSFAGVVGKFLEHFNNIHLRNGWCFGSDRRENFNRIFL